MEKGKNNKGVMILLTVIIVILAVLCILFATDTITLNTKTSENTTKETSNSQTNTNENQQTNDSDYDAEAIAKEKMPTALSFVKQESGVYTYCGNLGRSNLTNYLISKNYKTLNELKDYLSTVVTKEIYDKYFVNETDKYIEQDGNLYCSYRGADGLATHFISEENINRLNNLTYSISNKTVNSFDATLSFIYSSEIEGVTNKEYKYKASFIKENNNWLINNLEQQ